MLSHCLLLVHMVEITEVGSCALIDNLFLAGMVVHESMMMGK